MSSLGFLKKISQFGSSVWPAIAIIYLYICIYMSKNFFYIWVFLLNLPPLDWFHVYYRLQRTRGWRLYWKSILQRRVNLHNSDPFIILQFQLPLPLPVVHFTALWPILPTHDSLYRGTLSYFRTLRTNIKNFYHLCEVFIKNSLIFISKNDKIVYNYLATGSFDQVCLKTSFATHWMFCWSWEPLVK